jgi:hypothetical protein
MMTRVATASLVVSCSALACGGTSGVFGNEGVGGSPTSGSGGGGNAVGGSGAGGAPTACEPGDQEACYSGPPGTAGVGLCQAGTHTCLADGSGFSACLGEVTPIVENCGTPGDEDCDGAAPTCTGDHVWSRQLGGVFPDAVATPDDISVDSSGSIWITGQSNGGVNFGAGVVPGQADDVFIVKYAPLGTVEHATISVAPTSSGAWGSRLRRTAARSS